MADQALTPALFTIRLRISRWWLLFPVIACLIIITGCILYLTHSYDALKNWYLGLFPCLYKAWEWPQAFFTPAVKHSGNAYSLAGIAISVLLFCYFGRQFYKNEARKLYVFSLYRPDAWYLAALFAFGLTIWLYGMAICYPAYDEVFSAVNCAGIHPFQTASYYMLPNNHIFFNVLNSILGAFTQNKLLSGRLISGTAFAAFIPLLYYWLKSKTASRPIAAIFCALMLLQFPVWAFAFQGRGYSIYLLCTWTSFIFLQRYLKTGSRASLTIHAVAIVIGFWTLPTFLFWEAALLIYLAIDMLRCRTPYWPAIRAHVIAGACVFLVFLPVFCFSGKAAILENRYVLADKIPLTEYLSTFKLSFRSTIQYCFSGFVDDHNLSYVILFFLPLVLLPFIRKTRAAGITGFYVIMWVIFCILELYMQRFPFMRNLIAHYSVTLAALLLACHALITKALWSGKQGFQYIITYLFDLRPRTDWRKWRAVQVSALVAAGLFCVLFAVHFIRFNRDHLHDSLYFYHADIRYRALHDAIMKLPADARVGVSDEGFYWEYLAHQRGLTASMCLGASATHYIMMETEKLPDYLTGHIEKIMQVDEYVIYKVK